MLKYLIKKNKITYFKDLKIYYFLRFVLQLDNRKSLILTLNRKLIFLKEFQNLRLNKKKKMGIVYDLNCSPFTLGDFFNAAMTARFFQMKGYDINFFIIRYDLNQKILNKNKKRFEFFYQEFQKILKSLLPKKYDIYNFNWEEFNEYKNVKQFILFEKRVRKRKYIYGFLFNFLNNLILKENENFSKKFLLNSKNLKKNGRLKIPKFKYVTLHCRHNILQTRKKNNRNLKKNEFLKIIKKLKKKFKKHKIIVVSDKLGCNFFKKFAIEKKLKIEFSKKFSSSFINDGILVLNSDYYFQFWGGGINVFPWYSKLPHLRSAPVQQNELPHSKNQLSVWHDERHFFIENDRRDIEEFLEKLMKVEINAK